MIERVFAGIVLAVCIALMLRLVVGARRRRRVDAVLARGADALRRGVDALHGRVARLRRGHAARRDEARAAAIAEEAIQRARGRGAWDGNVYTIKPERKPRRDKMH